MPSFGPSGTNLQLSPAYSYCIGSVDYDHNIDLSRLNYHRRFIHASLKKLDIEKKSDMKVEEIDDPLSFIESKRINKERLSNETKTNR